MRVLLSAHDLRENATHSSQEKTGAHFDRTCVAGTKTPENELRSCTQSAMASGRIAIALWLFVCA
jgi:hypothetical protein